MQKNKFKLILILLFAILFNHCSVKYNYQNESKATASDLYAQKKYYETATCEYYRKNNQILLLFNNIGFENSRVLVDNKDTIMFKKISISDDCPGVRLFLVDKKNTTIQLKSANMKDLKIKIFDKYNYIKIDKYYKTKWIITYSSYLPATKCY